MGGRRKKGRHKRAGDHIRWKLVGSSSTRRSPAGQEVGEDVPGDLCSNDPAKVP